MRVNYLPDRDEDGTVRGCFALVVDVTEQREAERRLEQLQQQRTAILLAAGAGIYGLDLDGRVTFLNRAATLIAGWQEGDLIGQPMHPRLHHSHADGAPYDPEACPIYRTIKTGVSSRSDQDVFWRQDGTNFPVEYCSSPIQLEDGSVRGVVVTFRDITERRRTEQALRESEARFRAIFEQAAVGVAQIDTRTGRFLRVNRKYGEIVGLSETAMIESTFMALTHPEDLPADLDNMARLVAGKIRTFTMDKRYLRPDGSTVWVALTVSPLWAPGEHPDAHIAVVEDITVRKQTEERLSQSRAHLQALAAHVESVREGERTRIARELHDEVGQALAGFKMGLAHLAKGMEALPDEGQPVHLPTLLTQARDMQSTVDACVRDIRRLVTELRPPVLDHLDLPDALEWLAKDFHRRHGLPCRFTCDAPPGKMSLDAKTALFRIAQEALTNVTRHAQAAQAHIHLTHGADLQLTIDDDGRGLDAAAGENPLSFGLTGIRERARLLGGHADFLGRPGKGTQVIVHIPLQETP
jgi:PAS domain S-box-containing protein